MSARDSQVRCWVYANETMDYFDSAWLCCASMFVQLATIAPLYVMRDDENDKKLRFDNAFIIIDFTIFIDFSSRYIFIYKMYCFISAHRLYILRKAIDLNFLFTLLRSLVMCGSTHTKSWIKYIFCLILPKVCWISKNILFL